MFILRPLDQHIDRLGTSIFKLSLSLSNVYARGHSTRIPILRKLQGLFKRRHVRGQQLFFRVQRAHLKIVESELGVQTQAQGFQIGGAGLGVGTRSLHSVAHSSKDVCFIGHIEGNCQIGSVRPSRRSDQRPVLREVFAFCRGARRERRIVCRTVESH